MILGVILFVILLAASIALLIDWGIHISMVKDDSDANSYGWASYGKFKTEFNKHSDWSTHGWRDSLFRRMSDGYIHANVIRFDRIGMIMITPIDLLLVKLFVRSYISKNLLNGKPKAKYKWE